MPRKRALLSLAVTLVVWCCASLTPREASLGGGELVPALPTYICQRTCEPVVIDGRLDDAIWSGAAVFREFRLTDGETKPTAATEFRACWDDAYLYLAFDCADGDMIATMTERDSPLYDEDCVEAFLSTGGDLKRYYEFELSPRNVVMEASVFPNETGTDKIVDYGWDCEGLRTATEVRGALDDRSDRDEGWAIEIAIPFSQIGKRGQAPVAGEMWRTNFYRIDYGGKEPEFICWSPTLVRPASFHEPERFGRFVFAGERAEGAEGR